MMMNKENLDAARDAKEAARNRKGRRSTILTTSAGLNEISDEEINKKSLLGDN